MTIAGSMLSFMTPGLTDDVFTVEPDPDLSTLLSNGSVTRDEDLAKVEIGVLTAIFVLSFAGNVIVLLALISLGRRRKLSRMNTMIGHLAIADLVVAFCSVLPQLIWKIDFNFKGGNVLCKLVRYVQMLAMYSSSYVLLTTAIDRYIAICHPLRMHAWTQRRMHGLVVVAWSFSFALASPQLFIFAYDVDQRHGNYDCTVVIYFSWSRRVYVTFFAAAVYVAPLLILLFLYLRICLAVWRRDSSSSRLRSSVHSASAMAISNCGPKGGGVPGGSGGTAARRSEASGLSVVGGTSSVVGTNGTRLERRRARRLQRQSMASSMGTSSASVHPKHKISTAKLKTVKLTSLVVGSYFVCQGPFFVSHVWAAFDDYAPFEGTVMAIILLLANLNSCTNPWIYFAFNDQFSRIFTNISNRKRMLGRQPSPSTYSTDKDNVRIQLYQPQQLQQQQSHSSATESHQSSSVVTDKCRYSRM